MGAEGVGCDGQSCGGAGVAGGGILTSEAGIVTGAAGGYACFICLPTTLTIGSIPLSIAGTVALAIGGVSSASRAEIVAFPAFILDRLVLYIAIIAIAVTVGCL